MILSIKLKENLRDNNCKYKNKISAKDFKEISLVLNDLKNIGLPIDKAIKEYNLEKSDWDAALGL